MSSAGFDLRPMRRFIAGIKEDSPEMKACYEQWGKRYLTFTRRRFVKFSRGGGDWKPLAESTKKIRAKKKTRKGYKGPRKFSILWDLGFVIGALTIGAPGNLFKYLKGGVRVGFGGPAKHPKGKATIADIARFHDQGKGRLPRRRILVRPDTPTRMAMIADLKRAVTRLGRKSSR